MNKTIGVLWYTSLATGIIGFTTGFFFNHKDIKELNSQLEIKTSELEINQLLSSSQKNLIDAQGDLINTYGRIINEFIMQENDKNGYFNTPYYGNSPPKQKDKKI